MRFALAATVAAAVVAIPLGVTATGPHMSQAEFFSAVRCAAYSIAVEPQRDLGATRMALNGEARRQGAEATAHAQMEARAIARAAVSIESAADVAMMRAEARSACAAAAELAGEEGRHRAA